MQASPERHELRFGLFEVDLEAGQLRKNGQRVRLQEQPFRVLALLLERSERVVTREELLEKVWPDSHVDFDHSLNTAINKIRAALGDNAANPRFVETLPGRGYRFLVPVERIGETSESASRVPLQAEASPKTQPPGARLPVTGPDPTVRRKRLVTGAVASAALGIAALLGAVFWPTGPPTAIHEKPLTATPLTTFPGFEASPTFSPDGSQVAFTWDVKDLNNFDIYVMVVGQSEPLPLTDDARSDYSPAWSPDGQWIAFLRDKADGQADIRIVSPLGGAERFVTEVAQPARPAGPRAVAPRSLSWHPDGTALVIADQSSPDDQSRLFLVSVEGGQRRELTSSPGQPWGDKFGAFSPDGARLAFSRSTHHLESQLMVQRFSDALEAVAEPAAVTHGTPVNPHTCFWTEDQRHLVFSPFYFGTLWTVDADGVGEPRELAFAGNRVLDPTISYSSQRLAFARLSYEQISGDWSCPFQVDQPLLPPR